MREFITIAESVQSEITEKKSKFIANLFYVENSEEAEKIIKEIIENMYKSSFFENVDLLNSEKEETKYQHW